MGHLLLDDCWMQELGTPVQTWPSLRRRLHLQEPSQPRAPQVVPRLQ